MLTYRILNPENLDDVNSLQRILEGAPEFSLLVKGHPPLPSDGEETFKECPPGKTIEDKIVGGFLLGNKMIGCVDICRGYPNTDIAFIGLLIFMEKYQGCGYGREALARICSIANLWNCHYLRIAVIENNNIALKFWKRKGFTELYRKPVAGCTGDAIIMESVLKPLAALSGQGGAVVPG